MPTLFNYDEIRRRVANQNHEDTPMVLAFFALTQAVCFAIENGCDMADLNDAFWELDATMAEIDLNVPGDDAQVAQFVLRAFRDAANAAGVLKE